MNFTARAGLALVALMLTVACGGRTPPTAPSSSAPVWPTPATTGVPPGTQLTACGDSTTVTTDGAVIDRCLYTGNVIIRAQRVIIRNSEVHGAVRLPPAGGLFSFTIEDTTVGPPAGCQTDEPNGAVGHEHYTARRVHIRNTTEGFRVAGRQDLGPTLVEDSYVRLCSEPGAHADGFQAFNSSHDVTVNHNTFDLRDARNVTSAIFFADFSSRGTVTNNLVMGGGYTLRIGDDNDPDIGPWVITGNRIVDGAWSVGPVRFAGLECHRWTVADNRLVTIDSSYSLLTLGAEQAC